MREATAKEDQSDDGFLRLYIDPKDREMILSLPADRKARIIVERYADEKGWEGVFATKVKIVEPKEEPQPSERRKPRPDTPAHWG